MKVFFPCSKKVPSCARRFLSVAVKPLSGAGIRIDCAFWYSDSPDCGSPYHHPVHGTTTEAGPETDPTVILWEQLEISLTTLLGLTLWSVVRASWSQGCMHKQHCNRGRPTWDQFLALWVKVLRGWEEHPSPILPREEISRLIHALPSMNDNTVPPPPCPRTTLRKNRPLVPRSNFPHHLFLPG